jgi:hypothetical protein
MIRSALSAALTARARSRSAGPLEVDVRSVESVDDGDLADNGSELVIVDQYPVFRVDR